MSASLGQSAKRLARQGGGLEGPNEAVSARMAGVEKNGTAIATTLQVGAGPTARRPSRTRRIGAARPRADRQDIRHLVRDHRPLADPSRDRTAPLLALEPPHPGLIPGARQFVPGPECIASARTASARTARTAIARTAIARTAIARTAIARIANTRIDARTRVERTLQPLFVGACQRLARAIA